MSPTALDHLDVIDRMMAGGKTWQTTFWTRPATIEEFCTSGEHLKGIRLAPRQLVAIKSILGDDPVLMFEKDSTRPNIGVMCWGKGGGKNMVTTIMQQYVFYVLLCMRDPLGYFGFPQGESIDMLNVAASAPQAKKNFFAKFARRVKTWDWLHAHYTLTQRGRPLSHPEQSRGEVRITDDSIVWDAGVQCISAHSDSKGYEGYSVLFFVMDEASSWETEYIYGENGEQIAVSRAHSIYDTLRSSALSRSWKWTGCIISYPRNEDDFTLNMAQSIQKGEIESAWTDIAATWEVKPAHLWVSQETFEHVAIRPWGQVVLHPPKDFEQEFKLHPQQSELKYACIPARTNSYFIYQNNKIHECAVDRLPLVGLKPIDFTVANGEGAASALSYIGYEVTSLPTQLDFAGDYYAHIDLSMNKDVTTVVIGHAEPFEAQINVQDEMGERAEQVTRKVVIDQIILWEPDAARLVSTINVDHVMEQLDKVFDFRYISADQFQSAGLLEKIARRGKEAGQHNVRNPEYLLLRSLIHANAISFPRHPKLLLELEKLIWNGKRVDHLPHYSKDIADGVAGIARSIFLSRGKRRQKVKFLF